MTEKTLYNIRVEKVDGTTQNFDSYDNLAEANRCYDEKKMKADKGDHSEFFGFAVRRLEMTETKVVRVRCDNFGDDNE